MPKIDVKKDIEDAINIIEYGDSSCFGCHETSSIYPFTNEFLYEYVDYFNGREKMLSVIASGDQIFNAILRGTKKVEAFDISRFVKYYFNLKKAAIQALTIDEFIDMFITCRDVIKFISDADRKKYQIYFEKISYYLDIDTRHFWKYLLKFSNWNWADLYYSELFRCIGINKDKVIQNNNYLEKEAYRKLKSFLKEARINIKTGDILSLANTYTKEQDLIYLSNIHFYMNGQSYLNMLEKFRLSENGILVAYSFRPNDEKLVNFGGKVKIISERESILMRSNSLTNK